MPIINVYVTEPGILLPKIKCKMDIFIIGQLLIISKYFEAVTFPASFEELSVII